MDLWSLGGQPHLLRLFHGLRRFHGGADLRRQLVTLQVARLAFAILQDSLRNVLV